MSSFAILEDDDPALDEADDPASISLDGLSLVDPVEMLGCDAIICIDFEATCDDVREGSPSLVARDAMEIIEFPYVVLDVRTGAVTHREQLYVRPERLDGVTEFCTELTGITREQAARGCSLADAVARLDAYVAAAPATRFCLAAHRFCCPLRARDGLNERYFLD